MVDNKRIAKNTFLLYVRMLFMLIINIYASRKVLEFLGIIDFGIYDIVAGFISMFTLIGGTMTTATNRFFSIELGKPNEGNIKKTFSTAVIIHLLLGILIFIFAETLGVWFLNSCLQIPPDKIFSANWVFQISLIAFIINVINVPYNATIIAYERMHVFAYVSIVEATLKLGAIITLSLFDSSSRLIIYASSITAIAIIIRIIYIHYCKSNFPNCKWDWQFNRKIAYSMFSFVGWNLIGSTASIAKDQGVNIILNLFFGVAINAARGIASQVYNAISGFVTNFQMAINPQIIKSYSAGDTVSMFNLAFKGSKLSFFLMMILTLPIILKTPFILELWLSQVPKYADVFLRIILLTALIDSLSGPLITLMHASGKIRDYQIIVGGIQLLTIPIVYIFLKLGYPSYWAFVITFIISLISLVARIILLHKIVDLPIKYFIQNTLWKCFIVFLVSSIIPCYQHIYLTEDLVSTIGICFTSLICSLITIYTIGLEKGERTFINQKLRKGFCK